MVDGKIWSWLILVDILRLKLFTFDFMECLVCCRRNLSQDVLALLSKTKTLPASLNQTMYTHSPSLRKLAAPDFSAPSASNPNMTVPGGCHLSFYPLKPNIQLLQCHPAAITVGVRGDQVKPGFAAVRR